MHFLLKKRRIKNCATGIIHQVQKEIVAKLIISFHCKGSGNMNLVFNVHSNWSWEMLLLPHLHCLVILLKLFAGS